MIKLRKRSTGESGNSRVKKVVLIKKYFRVVILKTAFH